MVEVLMDYVRENCDNVREFLEWSVATLLLHLRRAHLGDAPPPPPPPPPPPFSVFIYYLVPTGIGNQGYFPVFNVALVLFAEEADTFNREFEDKIRGFRPVHRNHGHRQITDGRSRYEGSMPSVSRPRYISHVQPTSQLAISHAPPPLAPQLQPRAHIPSSKPASQSSMPYGK